VAPLEVEDRNVDGLRHRSELMPQLVTKPRRSGQGRQLIGAKPRPPIPWQPFRGGEPARDARCEGCLARWRCRHPPWER
jgi:hypothetical protein